MARWGAFLLLAALLTIIAAQQRAILRLKAESQKVAENLAPQDQPVEQEQAVPSQFEPNRASDPQISDSRDLLRLRNELHQLRERVQSMEALQTNLAVQQESVRQLVSQNQHFQSMLATMEKDRASFRATFPIDLSQGPPPPFNSYIGVVLSTAPQDLTNPQAQAAGVVINSVAADGAAAEAQLQSGDVILRIDGQSMTNIAQVRQTIGSHNPGQRLLLDYLRQGVPAQVTVVTRPPPQAYTR